MSKILRVQPASRIDNLAADGQEMTQQPYPLFVDEGGMVGRQDFWNGSILRVVGFMRDLAVQQVDLRWKDAYADPQAAVGMYVVAVDASGGMFNLDTAVERMDEVDTGRIGRPSDDGDATGGGPQINAENAAEYGGEE